MIKSEAQFHPEKPEDIDDAYNAKETLNLAQKAINKIKDKDSKEKAQSFLNEFIKLSPGYVKEIIATDKYRSLEETPPSNEYLKQRIEKRRQIHNQLIENLKNMTRLIIQSGVKNSKWQEYVEDNLLSKNPQKISWLAINIAKWKRIEKELKNKNK